MKILKSIDLAELGLGITIAIVTVALTIAILYNAAILAAHLVETSPYWGAALLVLALGWGVVDTIRRCWRLAVRSTTRPESD